ncbi:hypothetical protein ARZXY2_4555 (plasmid) [Arthrobacter sp. ZXY-2]|nr:hypothetical protein ARZXY2_4555 [Arthrobacter sp. ZXY-2]MBP2396894.1 hypothetical protein [Paenarthrobacter nicotinovorans]
MALRKRPLQRVKLSVLLQAFDRFNPGIIGLYGQHGAGSNGLTIQ